MNNIDPAIMNCIQFATILALISVVGAIVNELLNARREARRGRDRI